LTLAHGGRTRSVSVSDIDWEIVLTKEHYGILQEKYSRQARWTLYGEMEPVAGVDQLFDRAPCVMPGPKGTNSTVSRNPIATEVLRKARTRTHSSTLRLRQHERFHHNIVRAALRPETSLGENTRLVQLVRFA